MAIAVNTMRVGHKYYLINHGERTEFVTVEAIGRGEDFVVQDLVSLEKFKLSDLTQYGKGKDYELQPMGH